MYCTVGVVSAVSGWLTEPSQQAGRQQTGRRPAPASQPASQSPPHSRSTKSTSQPVMAMSLRALIGAALAASASAHGSLVHPRPRNSIDYLAGVNTQKCSNITGAKCENGQASFYYAQGCFIGCPACDHMSGRRQTDLCGLGKNATLNDPMLRTVNRNATAGSEEDICTCSRPGRLFRHAKFIACLQTATTHGGHQVIQ